MVSTAEIQRCVEAALPGARVQVADTTGGGDHFEVQVSADAFKGKGLVEQHQLVYGALKGALKDGRVHAVELKTIVSAS